MCININRNVFEHTYNVNCGKPYLRPCWYFCPDYQRSLLNYAIVIFAVDFLLIYLDMHLPVNENYHRYINVTVEIRIALLKIFANMKYRPQTMQISTSFYYHIEK